MRKRALIVVVAMLVVVAGAGVYVAVHHVIQGEVHVPQSRYNGPLRTQGTVILDSRDRPVRFYSLGENSLKPSRRGTQCFLPPGTGNPDYYPNLQQWGFNTAYLVFTWGSLEPTAPTVNPDGTLTHHFDQAYLRLLDTAIKQYNRHGINVVLKVAPEWNAIVPKPGKQNCSGHGMPAWLEIPSLSGSVEQSACDFLSNVKDSPSVPGPSPMEDFGDMWQALVSHYRGNRGVVGADMINEPYPENYPNCPGYDLPRLFQTAGSKIRAANPDILLMFEEAGTGDATLNRFALTQPIPFSNIVYVFHLYASGWSERAPTTLPYRINRPCAAALQNVWNHAGAPGWDIPIWVQEFNSLGYAVGNTGGFWSENMDRVLAFFRQHGISYGVSSYGGPNGVQKSHKPANQLLEKLAEGLGRPPALSAGTSSSR